MRSWQFCHVGFLLGPREARRKRTGLLTCKRWGWGGVGLWWETPPCLSSKQLQEQGLQPQAFLFSGEKWMRHSLRLRVCEVPVEGARSLGRSMAEKNGCPLEHVFQKWHQWGHLQESLHFLVILYFRGYCMGVIGKNNMLLFGKWEKL